MNASPMLDFMCQHQMIPRDSTVFVAVSGGSDSVYLLHRLYSLQSTLDFRLVALHYNHQLEKSGSFEAEPFVRQFVSEFCPGVPLLVDGAPVSQLAATQKLGVEEMGRRCRYDFFQMCAQTVENSRIATAHTAGDNAETALLQLTRGAGLRGLSGIPPVRGNIIRPLLTTTRDEIRAYLAHHALPHVEDPTNSDVNYTGRNAIRHQIIPILRGQNPNFLENFSATSSIFREEDALLDCLAAEQLPPVTELLEGLSLSAQKLAALPRPLALRGISQLATRLLPDLRLERVHRENILTLCGSDNPSASLNLPLGLTVHRQYDQLVFAVAQPPSLTECSLPLPCNLTVAGYRITASREVYCGTGTPWDFWVSGEYDELMLRPRQEGDRLQRPNRSDKTLKSIMIDEKIPRHLRNQLPVLCWREQIVAVIGLGVSQLALPPVGQEGWHITITEI